MWAAKLQTATFIVEGNQSENKNSNHQSASALLSFSQTNGYFLRPLEIRNESGPCGKKNGNPRKKNQTREPFVQAVRTRC